LINSISLYLNVGCCDRKRIEAFREIPGLLVFWDRNVEKWFEASVTVQEAHISEFDDFIKR
jgi:hypothetical protein